MSKLFNAKIIIPLIVGGLIYVFFRSPSLLMFKWFHQIGIAEIILNIKDQYKVPSNWLINWCIYSLPDGLWLYSLTAFMLVLWREESSKIKYLFIFGGAIIAFGQKIGQAFHLFKGTFDLNDIIAYILAILIAFITIKKGEGILKNG